MSMISETFDHQGVVTGGIEKSKDKHHREIYSYNLQVTIGLEECGKFNSKTEVRVKMVGFRMASRLQYNA